MSIVRTCGEGDCENGASIKAAREAMEALLKLRNVPKEAQYYAKLAISHLSESIVPPHADTWDRPT
jgi:hypothetical protein